MPSPRIDQDEAASREIRHIAGRQFGDAGHRGDLDVKGLDRSALTTAGGDDLGVVGGRLSSKSNTRNRRRMMTGAVDFSGSPWRQNLGHS